MRGETKIFSSDNPYTYGRKSLTYRIRHTLELKGNWFNRGYLTCVCTLYDYVRVSYIYLKELRRTWFNRIQYEREIRQTKYMYTHGREELTYTQFKRDSAQRNIL